MDKKTKAAELVSRMTLDEKASLCSGKDFWVLKGIERMGLPEIMVTDGPHGLRKQTGGADHIGLNESVPATCFPPACATACSFDREVLGKVGQAMGEECLAEEVAVILGPGVNIKRSPLCGRNFEYFSEDPFHAGEMGAAMINGVQSKGVGTSLKHFAANDQETRRLSVEAIVDERALREIYLTAFEKCVRQAQPWTVMNAYNQLNGNYCSENKWLLTDVLRNEWGYKGMVVTDWGAIVDRAKGIEAGVDLEMPHTSDYNDKKLVEAVRSGALEEELLDKAATNVVDLILSAMEQEKKEYDPEAHHAAAREAAEKSFVLLKNENNILPLNKEKSLAVLGAFAETPRYQGAGSSLINPHKVDNIIDSLTARGYTFDYAPGYSLKGGEPDDELIGKAVELAKEKDVVLICAGLPDEYESEGFDRKTLTMPDSHLALIDAVLKENKNVVVVLMGGGVMELPFADDAAGILLCYLGGEAVGSAAANVLTGAVCPSGKLAESWPVALEDNPSYRNFPGGSKTVEYRESIYVGYRYYDTAKKDVRYPFGYGLSYTSFEYSGLSLSADKISDSGELTVKFTVRNTGSVKGAEIAQIYVACKDSKLPRAAQELREFVKVELEPDESKELSVVLGKRAFAYYNTNVNDWCVEPADYEIRVSASSRDVRLTGSVRVDPEKEQPAPDYRKLCPRLYNPALGAALPAYQFEALICRPLPPSGYVDGETFTVCSTMEDVLHTKRGQEFARLMGEAFAPPANDGGEVSGAMAEMMENMMKEMPLRSMCTFMGVDGDVLEGLVDWLNGGSKKGFKDFSESLKNKRSLLG